MPRTRLGCGAFRFSRRSSERFGRRETSSRTREAPSTPKDQRAVPAPSNPIISFRALTTTVRKLERPSPLKPDVSYAVPRDKRAQLIYLRAGNSSAEMIYLVLSQNGRAMRYFPIGAKGATHVQLAIVEDLPPEARLELAVGAPEGLRGSIVVDLGLMEV